MPEKRTRDVPAPWVTFAEQGRVISHAGPEISLKQSYFAWVQHRGYPNRRGTRRVGERRRPLSTLAEGVTPMKAFDFNDVNTFVAIAHAGTMTATAKELHLPTSTVSRSLTRLEKNLGVLLMRRSPRGLVLSDAGKEYLHFCKRALGALKEGSEILDTRRSQPSGLLRVACPVTMARELLAPLLKEFLRRFPDLRVEIEPYCSGWDREPREDVDVFFKLRAPNDTLLRVRGYPGTARGLFASSEYIRTAGLPKGPDDLIGHSCIGSGVWRLSRGNKLATPNISFRVVSADPVVGLRFATDGLGITVLPLWSAGRSDVRDALVRVLPLWKLEPITLCALFFGASRLTPKVEALLDFLGEYIGTECDPRLQNPPGEGCFTDASIPPSHRQPSASRTRRTTGF
jgi:LysR family transcriptional activator of dmlA